MVKCLCQLGLRIPVTDVGCVLMLAFKYCVLNQPTSQRAYWTLSCDHDKFYGLELVLPLFYRPQTTFDWWMTLLSNFTLVSWLTRTRSLLHIAASLPTDARFHLAAVTSHWFLAPSITIIRAFCSCSIVMSVFNCIMNLIAEWRYVGTSLWHSVRVYAIWLEYSLSATAGESKVRLVCSSSPPGRLADFEVFNHSHKYVP